MIAMNSDGNDIWPISSTRIYNQWHNVPSWIGLDTCSWCPYDIIPNYSSNMTGVRMNGEGSLLPCTLLRLHHDDYYFILSILRRLYYQLVSRLYLRCVCLLGSLVSRKLFRGDPRCFFYWTRYAMGFMAGSIIHERHIFSINNNNGRYMAHGYDWHGTRQ